MITYDILLDSHAAGCQQTVHGFYRGEAGEKQLRITLMHPSILYTFEEGADVVVFGRKPDGTCIVHACEIVDGRAVYTPTTQTVAAVGSVQCQLVVYDTAGKILFTPEFCIEVAESVRNEETIESSNDFLYLDALILKANENMQFLRDIPALTSGSNGTLLCDDTLVGALVYAVDYRELPETPNGQLAYVQCDWEDRAAGFYLRIFDVWMHLPLPDAHRHSNKALLDALTDSHFHTHDNLSILGQLSEENGTLYFAGAPIGEAHLRIHRIGDDSSVIPPEPEGTLLYFVTGTDPDLLCYPMEQRTAPDGTVYWYNPPWQAGQLWISSGLRWNLLARHAWTENMQQGTADTVGDSTDLSALVHALQKTAHTHANMDALERIGQDTDDVVLLPMGEPLHLIARADFGSAPMYAMESFVRQNDPKYDFYVDGADGTQIRMVCNGVSVFDVEVNGTGYEFGAVELPETFTVTSVNGYASIEELPADMLEAYRTFCSFVNTSAEAMGSGTPIAGKAEIPTVGLLWNRTYAIRLDDVDNDSIEIFFAENADDDMIAQEAYTTVYVYFPQDIDAAISGVDYFIGDAPQTTQGWHKWVLSRLPNGQRTLSAQPLQNAA